MSQIDAHGLSMNVPAGWEGRIFRRNASGETRAAEVPGPAAPPGEVTMPLAHLATVPIPVDAADYGSDVVETLGPTDVFMVLKEFAPEEAAKALFARVGLPRTIDPEAFDPGTLQRTIPGQAGQQIFFQESGRAFCLYIVIGDFRRRTQLAAPLNGVLAQMRIQPTAEVAP